MKKYGLLLVSGLLCLSSCDDPFEGSTYVTPTNVEEEMSCTSLMAKYDTTFSLFIDLLKYADYYNALNDASASATVFAPTNQAIQEFLEWRNVASVRDLPLDYARSVVQAHIINGAKINMESFVQTASDTLSGVLDKPTLFLNNITLRYGYTQTNVDDAELSDEIYDPTHIYLNNQAQVRAKDGGGVQFITASNAVICFMNTVIHPLTETMIDKLEEQGEYAIFVAAARRSGYDKVVSRLKDTTYIAGGSYTVKTNAYTCFAPYDEAFTKAGISTVDQLEAKVKEAMPEAGDSALYRYVAYHFLDQTFKAANFFQFDTDDQVLIYDTSLKSQVVTCNKDASGTPLINETARVLRSNIEARNGLIHKIDYYMPVWSPEPVEVRWDFCNASDIVSFVNAYGVSQGIANLYTSPMASKEYQVDISENLRDGIWGDLTSITSQSNSAKANYSNYRAVGVKKCKYAKSTDKTTNAYGAYLNNLLVLNLGYAGWVQFETPTIIKGSYQVTLHYASEATMKSFHAAGSLTKFQLDPELGNPEWTKNQYVFKGFPTPTGFTYGSTDMVLWDRVKFDASGSHYFKATMLDINAKTNGSYHQLWDYVLFTPTNE